MDSTTAAWTTVASMISASVINFSTLEEWAKRVGLDKELETFNKKVVVLNTELSKIGAVVNPDDERSTELLKELQEIAYGSDDLLDEIDYYRIADEIIEQTPRDDFEDEIEQTPQGAPMSTLANIAKLRPDVKRHHSTSEKVSQIIRQIDHCMKELSWLLQQTGNTSNSVIQSIKSTQRMITSTSPGRVCGRDHEKDYLVMKLLSVDKALLSISIVGSVGVGKTTLAGLVYSDPRVLKHFDIMMWLTVSSDLDLCTVMHEILGRCSNDKHLRSEPLEMLLWKLKNILRSNRILIVVDDMWDGYESQWDLLLAVLKSSSEQGSVILVTTRSRSVAQNMKSSDMINLNGLEDEDIWNLLKSIIFQDDDWSDGNWSLEYIGCEIAKSLKGNPLLAKCIGSTLRSCELDDTEWRSVLQAIESTTGDRVRDVLRLSYDILPVNVQRCFSYCTLFPKNYTFNRVDLVLSWIAQGFVDLKSKRTMEDVGNEYLDFLVNRSLLQIVVEKMKSQYIVEYRMHHTLYDIVKVVSGDECVSLGGSEHLELPSTMRHISIINRLDERKLQRLNRLTEPEKLRSFILVGNEDTPYPSFLESFQGLEGATGLRVLRLDATPSFPSFFTKIINFIHLRYLKLDWDFETLPDDIHRLCHLQVLDIGSCTKLNSLPDNFNNLVELRHFVAEKRVHSMIAGVGKLTSLQELREFCIKMQGPFMDEHFGIEQLKNLKDLETLSICGLKNLRSKEDAAEAKLVEKQFLHSLSLTWVSWGLNLHELKSQEVVLEGLQPHKNLKFLHILGYGGYNIIMDSWLYNDIITSLVNLESISLENCLKLETLPPLGELPFLNKLCLRSMHGVKEIGDSFYGNNHEIGFQSLVYMKIEDMRALERWQGIEGPLLFPALKFLIIENCPILRELPLTNSASIEPEEDEWFPYLRFLVIKECRNVEQLPPFPHTHTLSAVSIDNVGSLCNLYLGIRRGELYLKITDQNIRALEEVLVFYNLRNLRSLSIRNCPNLENLSWEGIYSLEWLNYLRIEECPKIVSLSEGNEGWPP